MEPIGKPWSQLGSHGANWEAMEPIGRPLAFAHCASAETQDAHTHTRNGAPRSARHAQQLLGPGRVRGLLVVCGEWSRGRADLRRSARQMLI